MERAREKALKRAGICFFCICSLVLCPFGVFSRENEGGVPILILDSYHKGYPWTDSVIKGILTSLHNASIKTTPYIEYMDSRRLSSQKLYPSLSKLYPIKYSQTPLAAIVCSGDEAFNFLSLYGPKIFPGIPIVFTGIRNIKSPIQQPLLRNYTGTAQHTPFLAMVDVIMRLHPTVKKIIVIGDTTTAGEKDVQQLKEILTRQKDYIESLFLISPTFELLKNALSEESKSTVIIITSYFLNIQGENCALQEGINIIRSMGDFPIYSHLDGVPLLNGVLGGPINHGEEFGHTAAKMVLQILSGRAVKDIPIRESQRIHWLFNYREIKKFGISTSQLPSNSTIVNDPLEEIKEHYHFIVANLLVIATLGTLSILLFSKIMHRHHVNAALVENKESLSGLIEGAPEGIVLLNGEGYISRVNKEFCKMFNYKEGSIQGENLAQYISTSEERVQKTSELVKLSLNKRFKNIERFQNKKDGTPLPVSMSGFPVERLSGEKEAFLLFQDLTRKKAQERALALQFHLESLLSTVSSQLVLSRDFENAIQNALQEIGKRLGLLGCGLYRSKIATPNVFHIEKKWFSPIYEGTPSDFFTFSFKEEHIKYIKKEIPVTFPIENSFLSGLNATALPFKTRENRNGVLMLLYQETTHTWASINTSVLEVLASTIGETYKKKETQDELLHTISRLRETFQSTIATIGHIIEMKDHTTSGHQGRVAQLSLAIAKRMGCSSIIQEAVYNTSLVHDLGKLYIPSEILTKPEKLSSLEYQIVQQHPRFGFDVLKQVHFPWPVAEIVLQHHERLDGSGYPEGLKNSQILLEAKIIAVADVVEAMTSPRPHRGPYAIEKALDEIDRGAGHLYDPSVVSCCVNLFREEHFEFSNSRSSPL